MRQMSIDISAKKKTGANTYHSIICFILVAFINMWAFVINVHERNTKKYTMVIQINGDSSLLNKNVQRAS